MANATIQGYRVFPSRLGDDGDLMGELAFRHRTRNRIISGWALPSSGGTYISPENKIRVDLTGGDASLSGRYVSAGSSPHTYTLLLTPSVTEYVYLILDRDPTGQASGLRVESVTNAATFPAPADALYLGSISTNSTSITGSSRGGSVGRMLYGRVLSAGTIESSSGYWSVSKTGTGTYTLTFASGFFVVRPAVRVSSPWPLNLVTVSSTTSVSVSIFGSDGTAHDSDFSFVARL